MKYKLTNETINRRGKILHRIIALKDFGTVKKGDKGGFVEKESNLSQEGNCWLYDNAKAFDNATISDYVELHDDCEVYGNSRLKGICFIYRNVSISGNSSISGNYISIYDNVTIVSSNVYGRIVIRNNILIEQSNVIGYGIIQNNISMNKCFTFGDDINIINDSKEKAYLYNAKVTNKMNYIFVTNPLNEFMSFFTKKEGGIGVISKPFSGSLDELRENIKEIDNNDYHSLINMIEKIL